jgi:competence protein ComEC
MDERLSENFNARVSDSALNLPFGGGELRVMPPLGTLDDNDCLSVVCKWGEWEALVTGDMDSAHEMVLTEIYSLPDIELLIVGHHGSKYATTQDLLDAVTPDAAIISVGRNTYGHPTAETLTRLYEYGIPTYRTDENGSIIVRIVTNAAP